jgi:hypothetical protein
MTGDTEEAPRHVATNAGEIFIKRRVISFHVVALRFHSAEPSS